MNMSFVAGLWRVLSSLAVYFHPSFSGSFSLSTAAVG